MLAFSIFAVFLVASNLLNGFLTILYFTICIAPYKTLPKQAVQVNCTSGQWSHSGLAFCLMDWEGVLSNWEENLKGKRVKREVKEV